MTMKHDEEKSSEVGKAAIGFTSEMESKRF